MKRFLMIAVLMVATLGAASFASAAPFAYRSPYVSGYYGGYYGPTVTYYGGAYPTYGYYAAPASYYYSAPVVAPRAVYRPYVPYVAPYPAGYRYATPYVYGGYYY
jgi:hypothetical protein